MILCQQSRYYVPQEFGQKHTVEEKHSRGLQPCILEVRLARTNGWLLARPGGLDR